MRKRKRIEKWERRPKYEEGDRREQTRGKSGLRLKIHVNVRVYAAGDCWMDEWNACCVYVCVKGAAMLSDWGEF
jgi:hypothetical protein